MRQHIISPGPKGIQLLSGLKTKKYLRRTKMQPLMMDRPVPGHPAKGRLALSCPVLFGRLPQNRMNPGKRPVQPLLRENTQNSVSTMQGLCGPKNSRRKCFRASLSLCRTGMVSFAGRIICQVRTISTFRRSMSDDSVCVSVTLW